MVKRNQWNRPCWNLQHELMNLTRHRRKSQKKWKKHHQHHMLCADVAALAVPLQSPLLEPPVQTVPRAKCKCKCGCQRRPGRLIVCTGCGKEVGPGCCWQSTMCHVCIAPPPSPPPEAEQQTPQQQFDEFENRLAEAQWRAEQEGRHHQNHRGSLGGPRTGHDRASSQPMNSGAIQPDSQPVLRSDAEDEASGIS